MDADILAVLQTISDDQLGALLVKVDQQISVSATVEVLLVFVLAVLLFLCGLVFASILVRRWYM